MDGALLTGESYRAKNHARDEGADSPEVAEATNDAFVGSSVITAQSDGLRHLPSFGRD